MNMTTKLSVSSAILAAVLSGCSQQQVIGGSQVSGGSYSGGSQQVAGGSQVAGGGSQQQIEGGSQVGGSQQQVEAAAPVVIQPRVVTKAPIHVYKPKPVQRRVYTRGPKPRVTRSVKRRGLGLPAAKPGQCFAKVKVPATYKTQSRRILIQKATATRKLVRAPQYRWVNKKVLVRKASYRTRTIPAQYKTITKRVMVKPAYNTWRQGHGAITRIDNMTGQIMCRVQVPAVYKNVSRRVLVRKAQTQRTLVPAIYKTIKQKQFVAAAQYRTVRTPARYKTQNYRVKTGAAKYVWRAVLCQTNAPKRSYKHYKKAAPNKHYRAAPKQYRKAVVKRKTVVRKAYRKQYRPRQSIASGINYQDYLKVMRASVPKATKLKKTKKHSKKVVLKKRPMKSKMKAKAPAKKQIMKKPVTKQKMMKKSSTVKKSTTSTKQTAKASSKKSIVFGIQKALKDKGFDPGTMDGKMGPGTAAALKAFQSSRGLPVGQLNKDTFRALGLIR